MNDDECWLAIPGWDGYEASSLGRIRSVDRWITGKDGVTKLFRGRVRKLVDNQRDRRWQVVLTRVGPTQPVHVLIAKTFLGERPEGLWVCHNDGDGYNNRIENLRYDTPSSSKRTCKRKHPLNGPDSNVYIIPSTGKRQCMHCVHERREAKKVQLSGGNEGPSLVQ